MCKCAHPRQKRGERPGGRNIVVGKGAVKVCTLCTLVSRSMHIDHVCTTHVWVPALVGFLLTRGKSATHTHTHMRGAPHRAMHTTDTHSCRSAAMDSRCTHCILPANKVCKLTLGRNAARDDFAYFAYISYFFKVIEKEKQEQPQQAAPLHHRAERRPLYIPTHTTARMK